MCQFRNPDERRHVHHQFVHSGFKSNVFVVSSLIDMYAKCGSTEDAWKVFNETRMRNVVCWSAMIVGYVRCEQGQKALELSQQMHQDEVEPDSMTFVGILNACASVAALEEGRCVHKQIVQNGCKLDVYVVSSLIDMYAKCGMSTHDVISWSAMISGYVTCRKGQEALDLYREMQQKGVEPDHVTFLAVLNACTSIAALEEGRHIHDQIVQSSCESDLFVGSSLIDMYAKCGSIEDARRVFNKMTTQCYLLECHACRVCHTRPCKGSSWAF